MTISDEGWFVHQMCLTDATLAGHNTVLFWSHLIAGLDAGKLSVEAAIPVISRWNQGVTGGDRKVSRATAYRLVDHWRTIVADLSNPGRGA